MADVDPVAAKDRRDALTGALRAALEKQHDEQVMLNEEIERRPPSPLELPDDAELGELLGLAIRRATGLAGKQPASVEIVSPALDRSGKPAEELLTGERLGHFFGFLGDRFRQSDFVLGYRHMMIFLEESLPHYDVGEEVAAVLPNVESRRQTLNWSEIEERDATFKALKLAEKLGLVRLGGRVGLIIQNDVRKWNKGIPVRS